MAGAAMGNIAPAKSQPKGAAKGKGKGKEKKGKGKGKGDDKEKGEGDALRRHAQALAQAAKSALCPQQKAELQRQEQQALAKIRSAKPLATQISECQAAIERAEKRLADRKEEQAKAQKAVEEEEHKLSGFRTDLRTLHQTLASTSFEDDDEEEEEEEEEEDDEDAKMEEDGLSSWYYSSATSSRTMARVTQVEEAITQTNTTLATIREDMAKDMTKRLDSFMAQMADMMAQQQVAQRAAPGDAAPAAPGQLTPRTRDALEQSPQQAAPAPSPVAAARREARAARREAAAPFGRGSKAQRRSHSESSVRSRGSERAAVGFREAGAGAPEAPR